MEKEEKSGFAYVLLCIIRVLYILLLLVIIYAAYQGAMFAKDIRDTAHTRMQNGDFPIPIGGVAQEFGGVLAQQMGGSGQTDYGNKDSADPQMTARDPTLQPYVDALQKGFESGDINEVRRQLTLLEPQLAQKGMTEAQQTAQQLMQAIDRGDNQLAEKYAQQLMNELR